ncbi:TIGR02450 family Trp-rich protein [Zhongshania sp.]|uniref:TIGR02450 family Trp-rich protein n=1 Tax=Zhongshania sp. TaxID=1971902 RepID=UPI003563E2A5
MNAVNPKKLLNSKWTAVSPKNKEKHFIITEVEFDEYQTLYHCMIEAVMSKRSFTLQWRELRDANLWIRGWQ